MPRGTCPDCGADVHVDEDADKGDTIECDECATSLRLVGLDPIELDSEDSYEDEDGYEEEDDDDEDDDY